MRHLICRIVGYGVETIYTRLPPYPYEVNAIERGYMKTTCLRCGKRLNRL